MSTDDTMADRLYPSTREAEVAAAAPAPAASAAPVPNAAPAQPSVNDMADRLYGAPAPAPEREDTPREILEERLADAGRRMYPAFKQLGHAIPTELAEAGVDAREWTEVATDLGGNLDDLATFSSLAQAHFNEPTTPEMHAGWMQDSQTLIKERGITPAELNDARKFVARDPRLFALLDQGLGSHPKVVERMVELARTARRAGRLK